MKAKLYFTQLCRQQNMVLYCLLPLFIIFFLFLVLLIPLYNVVAAPASASVACILTNYGLDTVFSVACKVLKLSAYTIPIKCVLFAVSPPPLQHYII